jgi:hypothetical protein
MLRYYQSFGTASRRYPKSVMLLIQNNGLKALLEAVKKSLGKSRLSFLMNEASKPSSCFIECGLVRSAEAVLVGTERGPMSLWGMRCLSISSKLYAFTTSF